MTRPSETTAKAEEADRASAGKRSEYTRSWQEVLCSRERSQVETLLWSEMQVDGHVALIANRRVEQRIVVGAQMA